MESPYPFAAIWINGRSVSIEKILSSEEPGRSPFEDSTFAFIRAWLSGEENFDIQTSGSTGTPKMISISRNQMIVSSRRTSEKIGIQKNWSALVCIDTRYIGGKMMLARCLTLGLRIVAVDPTANPLVRIPVDRCVQFTALVPYQVRAILESKHPHLLNNPEKILVGGAPLSASICAQLDRLQCECYETYGMTETVSHVALRLVNTKRKQPYFEALPGIGIDQDDRDCLVIRADYLPEPAVTNDLVELVGPGQFVWRGRFDAVINTGGVKVVPERVEKELEKIFHLHGFTHRFFIAALPDEKLGHKVVLVLEGVQFSSEILQQSLQELKSIVTAFEFPKEVHKMPQFVMTATGKIHRIQTLAELTRHDAAI